MYLGIDVGGTEIKYALLDEQAHFISQDHCPTPTTNLEDFLEALDAIVLPHKKDIQGIAMSMPGKIDTATGYMYTGGSLSHFIFNIPLGEQLSQRYQCPVSIENDAKCAALAESWLGALKDYDHGVVIILGTGIGGGIILNREVWRGFKGSAGEISNLPTDYHDLYNPCTQWSFLNGYKSLTYPYETRKGLPHGSISGRDFFDAYHAQDADAVSCFETYIDTMVAGIITIQTVLDVEIYCIGGGISAQDCLIAAISKKVDEYFTKNVYTPLNKPHITRCQFKNDANIIGALKTFLNLKK